MSKKKNKKKKQKKKTEEESKRTKRATMKRNPLAAGFIDMKKLGFQEPDAIRQLREMADMKKLGFQEPDAIRQLREMADMKKLGFQEPDAVRQLREMAETFDKPYRDHARMMRGILEPYERTRKMLDDSIAMRTLRRQMPMGYEFEKLLAPYGQQQSRFEQMLTAFQPRTSAFQELITAALQPSAALTLLADAERVMQNFRIEGVTATGATINGEEISFVDAEEELERAWSTTAALPSKERVGATSRRFAESRQPPLVLILLAYILGAMFESPIQTVSDPVLVPRAQQVRQWLQQNLPSIWLTTVAPELRTVRSGSLDLRLHARRNSIKVGILYERDRVEVLSKRKDWTLVVSLNDENLGGWVFSRYLERLPPAQSE